jgi:hypothetical protein
LRRIIDSNDGDIQTKAAREFGTKAEASIIGTLKTCPDTIEAGKALVLRDYVGRITI